MSFFRKTHAFLQEDACVFLFLCLLEVAKDAAPEIAEVLSLCKSTLISSPQEVINDE